MELVEYVLIFLDSQMLIFLKKCIVIVRRIEIFINLRHIWVSIENNIPLQNH